MINLNLLPCGMSRYITRFILWGVLFYSFQIGWAQDYQEKSIPTLTNGGSLVNPRNLYIDDNGFLWYTTLNGIVKYNGKFNKFYALEHPAYLHDIYSVSNLYKTTDGERLIVLTADTGIYIKNLSTDASIVLLHKDSKLQTNNTGGLNLGYTYFKSIEEDEEGNLWMGSLNNSIYRLDCENQLKRIEIEKNEEFDPLRVVLVKAVLGDNSILVQYGEKRWYTVNQEDIKLVADFRNETNKWENSSFSEITSNGRVFPKDQSGSYFYMGEEFFYWYVKEIDKQIAQFPIHQGVTDIKLLYNKDVFQGHKHIDLLRFEGKLIELLQFVSVNGILELQIVENLILDHKIKNVDVDPRGILWADTENGLISINLNASKFTKHLYDLKTQSSRSCRTFIEDSQGTIFVFTHSGVFKKERGSTTFKKLDFKNSGSIDLSITSGLYDFYFQNDSTVWGSGFSPLCKIDLKNKTYEYIDDSNNFIKAKTVLDLEPLDENTLLMAAANGLFEIDLTTYDVTDVGLLNETYDIRNIEVFNIYINRDRTTLWIGMTNLGLYRKDLLTNEVTYFSTTSGPVKLVDNNITCFYEDEQQNLWVGTRKGLQKINPFTYDTQIYDRSNGLYNDHITTILKSGDDLWFGTYDGLVQLNTKTGFINDFDEEDGLTNNEFNMRSALEASDGTFYFGGIDGFISFNPKEEDYIGERNYKIFLAEARKYDKDKKNVITSTYGLNHITRFTFPYNHNYGSLQFVINDVFHSDKTIYQYRIKKINEEWVDMGNYNTVQLNGLSPGEYTLKVRGYAGNGSPTNTLTYDIQVEQIFYKRTWFLATLGLSMGFIFFIWNWQRINRIRLRFEEKRRMLQLEASALQRQMNSHFIFNTLNSLQSIMFLKGERETNKYFGIFSRLIRLTLDMNSRDKIVLKDEIEYLQSYISLEKLRLNGNLEVVFDIDPALDTNLVKMPAMLFQPIVENAIFHGLKPKKKNRLLKISMHKRGNILEGVIEDNGIGRDASMISNQMRKNHTSHATKILNERISILNLKKNKGFSCRIVDLKDGQEALGTRVYLDIPFEE